MHLHREWKCRGTDVGAHKCDVCLLNHGTVMLANSVGATTTNNDRDVCVALRPATTNNSCACAVPRCVHAWSRYNMSQSTIIMPCNTSGMLDPAFFSRFGIVDVDWSNQKGVSSTRHA
jgi:hypothetical protein